MSRPAPVGVFVFGQAGCPACSEYIPRFQRIAAAFRRRFPIGVYDLARGGQRVQELATTLNIKATPTTVVMSRGHIRRHVGALAEAAIRELLEGV
jgi:thioredoxin-like negative regulator of GroEL